VIDGNIQFDSNSPPIVARIKPT